MFGTTLHTFNGPLSGTTRVSRYQKGKTNLDFTEERDIEWHWHHLGRMQVCTLLQTDNHAGTPPLSFLQVFFYSLLCSVKDRFPSTELRVRLAIDDITLVLQQNKSQWYGHVLQK